MRIRVRLVSALACAAALSAASAVAGTLVDFTDSTIWSGQDGAATTSHAYADFTVSLTSQPPDRLNFTQPFDGPAAASFCAANGGPLACGNDGVGVIDDEITFVDNTTTPPTQSVTLTFDKPVNLGGIHFLDLYECCTSPAEEEAQFYFDGDPTTTVAVGADEILGFNDGYLFLAITRAKVTSITFFEGFGNDGAGLPDFSLAAVQVAPVPLPAAGALLLAGLLGLGALGRRRHA
jgi:hypothetical protein